MITQLRTSLKILLVALGVSILIAIFSSIQKPTKYTIRVPRGSNYSSYYTNNYTLNGGCITFKNYCGCKDENTITVCGNYTIITK